MFGVTILGEGHGTGEGRGESPGEVHDTALKAAETDATKRALATFGRPFGLELYRGSKNEKQGQPKPVRTPAAQVAQKAPSPHLPQNEPAPLVQEAAAGQQSLPTPLPVEAAPELAPVAKFAHDDTTPIPRPSTYFGREHYHDIREENDALMRQAARDAAAVETSPTRRPASPPAEPEMALADPETMLSLVAPQAPMQRIDKAALPLGEPKRIRDKEHLKFVARQPCLVCGRQPSDAHHLRFAQPRALSMKVSDEFTVPLCRTHHRNLHQTGNELTWWEKARIDPLPIARKLWETSHPRAATKPATPTSAATGPKTVAVNETKPIAAVQS